MERKIIFKFLLIVTISWILYGCSDTTPVPLTEENRQYIGVWQLRIEEATDSSLRIDNMLLAVNTDSTAVYRRCEVNKSKSKNSSSSSSYSVNFPEAVVTNISQGSITVAQKLGWFGFDSDLVIDKAPYQEGQQWYVDIEGKRLARLSNLEIETMTNWSCPSSDDEE